ncbi:MAG TPA: thioredoxin family protein [Candidatus Hydrogenedentes bacterium]|nr:thioredoxin family protein [Candidatus Hydrogenedentota bacterium]HQH54349.1 thioredoxin family protein [Candidatus Hydrogenedentota bacterium]
MPRPPILPVLDWQSIFATGKNFEDWLKRGENPDRQETMKALRAGQEFEPHTKALLNGLARPVHVVAIAEDWCGDVVRHVPVLQALADAAPNLQVRYIHRADHPDVFARFLTNGGEAIPKFVFLNDKFVECGNWGPMPALCRELIARGKACGDIAKAREKVSGICQADTNRRMVVEELLQLIDIASSIAP